MKNELKLEEPKSFLMKPVKIADFRAFLKEVTYALASAAATGRFDMGKLIAGIAANLGVAHTPGEYAWALVFNAMTKALGALIEEYSDWFQYDPKDKDFSGLIDRLFTDEPRSFTINAGFFDRPGDHEIVPAMQDALRQWLAMLEVEADKAGNVIFRLPRYFTWALQEEYRAGRNKYKKLRNHFNTPFFKAEEYAQEWDRYCERLKKQAAEPVFGESFSLEQIYIKLTACYRIMEKEKIRPAKTQYKVVDLEEHLEDWLARPDSKDPFKVIMGDPGCGKSSLCKMLAAKQCGRRRTIYIPLHELSLKKEKELPEVIGGYFKNIKYFSKNPFVQENSLFVIFDGLDEMAEQGKTCAELARQFIDEVRHCVNTRNAHDQHIKVLFVGRPVAMGNSLALFKKESEALYVLRYREQEKLHDPSYIDPQQLLKQDKRDEWWLRYGRLKGLNHGGLPTELKGKKFYELSSQPLLNYLLAFSYTKGKIDFSEGSNLNGIYNDLITDVFDRRHSYGKLNHHEITDIDIEQFNSIMEEIAVSAWHGEGGRKAAVKNIESRCRKNGTIALLKKFTEDAQKGLINLLAAFYFKHSENVSGGEPSFEFTHKSFSEYLLAKRIVRQLKLSYEKLNGKNDDSGMSERQITDCLEHWVSLCGGASLDKDIFAFLMDEITLPDNADQAQGWQDMLVKLISHVMRYGLPFKCFEGGGYEHFSEAEKRSRNAEEALLAAHSACATQTLRQSEIVWHKEQDNFQSGQPGNTRAADWINKLRGQGAGPNCLALKCLNHISFYGQNLQYANFNGAHLMSANLNGAHLMNADFNGTTLSGAHLKESNLYRAVLRGADLREAVLLGAVLRRAVLREADLRRADLRRADLRGADLRGADLRGADLLNAKLTHADLTNADLGSGKLDHDKNVRLARKMGAIIE